jgi:Fic family protein
MQPSDIERMYSLIAEIDAVKKSWHLTKKLSPHVIERLTKSVIVTSAGASNRIEGNRLSDQEVEQLYRQLHIKKMVTRDQQEIGGYIEVLECIFNHYQEIPITESFVLKLHQDMLEHSDKDAGHKGRYKVGSNRVEAKDEQGNLVGIIFDPTPPYLVKKEMLELIDTYRWAIEHAFKHPLILIANFIFEFLAIHPFQDGNGRVSRLLTNLMLLQQGYYFTMLASHEKVVEEQKVDYYLALNKTQKSWKQEEEDITPWMLFFLEVVKIQSQKAINLLEHEPIEYIFSPKQLALWQWIQQEAPEEFTRKDAISALGFHPRTVEEGIKKLLALKRLELLGEGRATRYKRAISHNLTCAFCEIVDFAIFLIYRGCFYILYILFHASTYALDR